MFYTSVDFNNTCKNVCDDSELYMYKLEAEIFFIIIIIFFTNEIHLHLATFTF